LESADGTLWVLAAAELHAAEAEKGVAQVRRSWRLVNRKPGDSFGLSVGNYEVDARVRPVRD
jgi:hypothetical protein